MDNICPGTLVQSKASGKRGLCISVTARDHVTAWASTHIVMVLWFDSTFGTIGNKLLKLI